ncbi:MAG: M23 family metallopeptidase [Sulfurimonadaceae bacterium]|jgi:murein DD-endopeptidase MepM/ murein hydrolase activator NlpD|nr:M23 family metallopeptidase [Sulfurimonadaceae bacterium]
MRHILLLSIFTLLLSAFSYEIDATTVANGQTTLVQFTNQEGITYEKAIVDEKEYKILQNPFNKTKSYILVPINYYTKPSEKKIAVYFKKNNKSVENFLVLTIEDAHYPKEELQVSDSKVHLSAEDKQRAQKEYQEAMRIYQTVTPKSYINSEFIVPLSSKITSAFGKARTFNGSLKSYHGGTDFRAATGAPIRASNDGVVAIAKDRFYAGGSVIIDHGHGIYTSYFHLSAIHVQEGERVKKSQIVGLAGATGRVTGPHLHFGVRVNAEQVDPLQFITLVNSNLIQGQK